MSPAEPTQTVFRTPAPGPRGRFRIRLWRMAAIALFGLLQSCMAQSFDYAPDPRRNTETITGGKTQPVLSWKFRAKGPLGGPAVNDGVVYVGCGTRDSTTSGQNVFYALDAKTGAKRWSISMKGDLGYTPLVAKGAVIFVAQDAHPWRLVLISLETSRGRERWRRPLDGLVVGELKWNRTGSIAIVTAEEKRGKSYRVVQRWSIDPNSGRILSRRTIRERDSGKVVHPPPHVSALQTGSDVVYWGDTFGAFFTFHRKTEKNRWSFTHPRLRRSSTRGGRRRTKPSTPWFFPPVIRGNVVYLGGNYPHVYALQASTGQTLWRVDVPDTWAAKPLLATGDLVLVSDLDRTAYAVDRASGKTLWKINEEERTTAPGERGIIGHGFSGVAVDRRGLYFSSKNEVVYGYRFVK